MSREWMNGGIIKWRVEQEVDFLFGMKQNGYKM